MVNNSIVANSNNSIAVSVAVAPSNVEAEEGAETDAAVVVNTRKASNNSNNTVNNIISNNAEAEATVAATVEAATAAEAEADAAL